MGALTGSYCGAVIIDLMALVNAARLEIGTVSEESFQKEAMTVTLAVVVINKYLLCGGLLKLVAAAVG